MKHKDGLDIAALLLLHGLKKKNLCDTDSCLLPA